MHRELLIKDLASRPSLQIAGTMMTFTEDEAFDREQLRRFDSLTSELTASGVKLGARHAASSFALFQHPDSFLDMVRPGMALFGVYSEAAFRGMGLMDLQPALGLKARVAYVKRLEAGDSAGYERAYVAQRPVWVARRDRRVLSYVRTLRVLQILRVLCYQLNRTVIWANLE